MKVLTVLLAGVAATIFWWVRPPTEQWVDMVRSHTRIEIPVVREVEFHFGKGELSNALHRWPSKHSLQFTNPVDGKRVSWVGDEYVYPVLLDVVSGTPWLVINSSNVFENTEKYGCPSIPYVFLKYSSEARKWTPVPPRDSPPELREANLSYDYQSYLMTESRTIAADQIYLLARSAEVSTAGYFNVDIPRSFDQWKYHYKKSSATTRFQNDCREPLPQPIDYIAAFGPSRRVDLEPLENEKIDPELVFRTGPNPTATSWDSYSWDTDRVLACKDRIMNADDQDQRLRAWQKYVQDPKGVRIFPNGYIWFCDVDVAWIFGNRQVEPGRVVITKTLNDGEILYKVSFSRPPIFSGADGVMRLSTFHEKDGYVFFEWVSIDSGGYEVRAKHIAKYRFKEPKYPGS